MAVICNEEMGVVDVISREKVQEWIGQAPLLGVIWVPCPDLCSLSFALAG